MKKDHIKTHTISVLKITALFLILVLLLVSCGTVPKNNSNGAAPEPEKEEDPMREILTMLGKLIEGQSTIMRALSLMLDHQMKEKTAGAGTPTE